MPSSFSSRRTAARSGGSSGTGRSPSATTGSSISSRKPKHRAAKAKRAQRFGHAFADPRLLEQALTHASAGGAQSNERLEFLGDRVLGLLIAEDLIARFPGAAEGELAPRFNALVRKETCAAVAREQGVDKALAVAASERGAPSAAILADACEALIAALYLDGGIEAARKFVTQAWARHLASLSADMRDPKTALQEWAQSPKGGSAAPVYAMLGRSGPDHAPRFRVSVRVKGKEPAEGEGASKREAEQAAARAMMEKLGI